MVTYSRMEAKLIHGQTTTVLRNRYKCDGIILVDDMVAKDGGMRAIFSAAAPPGVKVYFFNTEKALIQLKKAADSELNYFVIFRGPLDVKRIVQAGYVFSYPVVCGQQFTRNNTVAFMQGVGLTEEELEALDFLEEQGVQVLFDPSCTNENLPWDQVKRRIQRPEKL